MTADELFERGNLADIRIVAADEAPQHRRIFGVGHRREVEEHGEVERTALADRLVDWGAAYGDLPAHDSLWDAAQVTADDLSARLAIIPMTLEARGIDTTPGAIERCRAAGDPDTAAVLQRIYTDEIKHLAVGVQWFEYCCSRAKVSPQARYAALLAERFRGDLKPPFNLPARAKAGMDESYLKPWL